MCCGAFIAKYVLFIANLLFSLLGLGIIGLGIAVTVPIKELQQILPVNIVLVTFLVLGAIVFTIGFLGCCGALRESRWMLICYSVVVCILLAAFIYLTVVVMGSLATAEETVHGWIETAFDNSDLRPVFHVMEAMFRCCGTEGPASYTSINEAIPASCCADPSSVSICSTEDAFHGCGTLVGGWFETFSGAIGVVLLTIIIVQFVAVIFALFLTYSIGVANKDRKRQRY